MVVARDDEALALVLERAFGCVHVHQGKARANVLETESHRSECDRIELDAYSRFRAATDRHLADAFHLADALADDLVGQIVNLRQWQSVRSHGQDHDGRIGWIDFAIGRRVRQSGRHSAGRGVDRGLQGHSAAPLSVAAEIELDGNRRSA